MQIKTSVIFDTKPTFFKFVHRPILTKVRQAGCFLSHWQKSNWCIWGGEFNNDYQKQNYPQCFISVNLFLWKFLHKCAKIFVKMHIVSFSPKKVPRDYPNVYRLETDWNKAWHYTSTSHGSLK